MEGLGIGGGDAVIGDEGVDQFQRAEPGEGGFADLGAVGHERDAGGGLDHRLFQLEVGEAGIGEAGVERDPGGGEEELAGEDRAEVFGRLVARERERGRLELAAGHVDGIAGNGAEDDGDVQRSGDDGEVAPRGEAGGDFRRRRAGVEDDGLAILDQRGGQRADAALAVHVLLVVERHGAHLGGHGI